MEALFVKLIGAIIAVMIVADDSPEPGSGSLKDEPIVSVQYYQPKQYLENDPMTGDVHIKNEVMQWTK